MNLLWSGLHPNCSTPIALEASSRSPWQACLHSCVSLHSCYIFSYLASPLLPPSQWPLLHGLPSGLSSLPPLNAKLPRVQAFLPASVFTPACLSSRVVTCNTISMPTAHKFLSLAQNSLLNSRLRLPKASLTTPIQHVPKRLSVHPLKDCHPQPPQSEFMAGLPFTTSTALSCHSLLSIGWQFCVYSCLLHSLWSTQWPE